ncbi:D-erythronate dehydrogenase [Microbacterium immunditiarum]|uniref:Nucleoside-diphosphate-sugar epimerase n=1 Tax=Microbacterium immunditiarum TaxID=337480 RepID=A0A7Y9GKX6_9MICO|nr:D-erythronate dehydrogenase [Microbacterium immunditiarum]NYE18418.1 nucleoside-diphosphate-sugar epimerase [Microbacterium immunditiarum]
MRVIVTGGAGFLGQLVTKRLLNDGADHVTLVDLAAPRGSLAADPRIELRLGDLAETLTTLEPADLVVHLAAVVSSAAEDDFDLGMRVNIDATRGLLDRVRAWRTAPVVVFSSSLAVFGADPHLPPPDVVADDTLPRPQSSYGVQKLIGEHLVADYTRKGFLHGRSVRLMTVAVRPGAPNAAASSFVSGIIREPLAGVESICPVDPDLPIIVSSPRATVDGILAAAHADEASWGSRTAMNLPGLTTTPREMAAALDRVAGTGTSGLIRWERDPGIEEIVASWPARFAATRAERLGLSSAASFDDIVRTYLEDRG